MVSLNFLIDQSWFWKTKRNLLKTSERNHSKKVRTWWWFKYKWNVNVIKSLSESSWMFQFHSSRLVYGEEWRKCITLCGFILEKG